MGVQFWQDFIKGPAWSSLLKEISDREVDLIGYYKDNDQLWNSEVIRGKLTELDFFRQIPQLLLVANKLKEIKEIEDGTTESGRSAAD